MTKNNDQEIKKMKLAQTLKELADLELEKEKEAIKLSDAAIKNAEALHTFGTETNTLLESVLRAPKEFDSYINDESIYFHKRQIKFIEEQYKVLGNYYPEVTTSGLTMATSGSSAYFLVVQNFSAEPKNIRHIGWSQESMNNINQLNDTRQQIESNYVALSKISPELEELYDEAVKSFKNYQVKASLASDSAMSMRNFLEKMKGLIINKSRHSEQIDASHSSQIASIDSNSNLTKKEKEWWKASVKLAIPSQGYVNTLTLQHEYRNYFDIHNNLSNIMKEKSPSFNLDDIHSIYHSHIYTLLNLIDNNKIR